MIFGMQYPLGTVPALRNGRRPTTIAMAMIRLCSGETPFNVSLTSLPRRHKEGKVNIRKLCILMASGLLIALLGATGAMAQKYGDVLKIV
ncbi:MAG: hypothetical protein GWN54_07005, partial [Gammaproteobacteria bacterium]|nr:hypothetical protein [Gammaproteobacteria bacterium]